MSILIAAHRSDHFTDEDGWCPPVARARDEPLAVELQEELGTWVDVNTSAMLPDGLGSTVLGTCFRACIWLRKCINLTDLELIGDKGGEVGAGVSASSSSSSPHSSSLSGVMLFPSHTEWMDTWKRSRNFKMTYHYNFENFRISTTSSCTVHLIPVPVCSPCCPSPSLCWSEAAASRGWSACLLKQNKKKETWIHRGGICSSHG